MGSCLYCLHFQTPLAFRIDNGPRCACKLRPQNRNLRNFPFRNTCCPEYRRNPVWDCVESTQQVPWNPKLVVANSEVPMHVNTG